MKQRRPQKHTHRAIPLALASDAARELPAAACRILVLLYLDQAEAEIPDDSAHVRRELGLRGKYNSADVRRALDRLIAAGLLQRDGGTLTLPGFGEFVCRRSRVATPRNDSVPRVSPVRDGADPMKPAGLGSEKSTGYKGTPLRGVPHYTPGTCPTAGTADRLEATTEPAAGPLAKIEGGEVDRETFALLQRNGLVSTLERFEDNLTGRRGKCGS